MSSRLWWNLLSGILGIAIGKQAGCYDGSNGKFRRHVALCGAHCELDKLWSEFLNERTVVVESLETKVEKQFTRRSNYARTNRHVHYARALSDNN